MEAGISVEEIYWLLCLLQCHPCNTLMHGGACHFLEASLAGLSFCIVCGLFSAPGKTHLVQTLLVCSTMPEEEGGHVEESAGEDTGSEPCQQPVAIAYKLELTYNGGKAVSIPADFVVQDPLTVQLCFGSWHG